MANKKTKTVPVLQKQDKEFLNALGILFTGPKGPLLNRGKEVDAAEALPCVDSFINLMQKEADHDKVYFRFLLGTTLNVSFTGVELLNWITKMVNLSNTVVDSIRVRFALYTPKYAADHAADLPDRADERLSVFLWPYLGDKTARNEKGDELNPYNLGGMEP